MGSQSQAYGDAVAPPGFSSPRGKRNSERQQQQFLPHNNGMPHSTTITQHMQAGQPYELIPHRVFVGGFGAATTEADLREVFERFYRIREVKVVRTGDGLSKGFGFITFDTEGEAKAIQDLAASNPENFMLRERRLNLGPALRKLINKSALNPPAYTDYAMATPSGQLIPSPTMHYGYSYPSASSPYGLIPTMAQPMMVSPSPSYEESASSPSKTPAYHYYMPPQTPMTPSMAGLPSPMMPPFNAFFTHHAMPSTPLPTPLAQADISNYSSYKLNPGYFFSPSFASASPPVETAPTANGPSTNFPFSPTNYPLLNGTTVEEDCKVNGGGGDTVTGVEVQLTASPAATSPSTGTPVSAVSTAKSYASVAAQKPRSSSSLMELSQKADSARSITSDTAQMNSVHIDNAKGDYGETVSGNGGIGSDDVF